MGDDADKGKDAQFKVFVGGLPYKLDDAGLKDVFHKYDPVEAVVMVDKYTGRSRAFGFVIFKDKESVDDAIRDLHDTELEGRKVSVRRAVPQDQIKPGTPASHIGGGGGGGYGRREYGGGSRGGYGRDGRDGGYGRPAYGDRGGGYDRGSYDRGGGGYGGGSYDRGGSGAYGAYDASRYYGHDSRGYGGGSGRYGDPYASGHYGAAAYDAHGTYDRYAPPPYDYGRGADAYDPYRGGGGPDRSRGYPPPRSAGPYDRPEARRDVPRR